MPKMKPDIWPKLNEIHERWLTNDSTIEMFQEMVQAIQNNNLERIKQVNGDKVNGSSYYGMRKIKANILSNSFNSSSGNFSPRPQTPPTNLYPSKSPRSPRRNLAIDYKKEVIQTKTYPGSSGDGDIIINKHDKSFKSLNQQSQIATVTAFSVSKKDSNREAPSRKSPVSQTTTVSTGSSSSQTIKPQIIPDIPRFYFSKGKPATQKEIESTLQTIKEKLMKISQDGLIPRNKLSDIIKIVELPYYWKQPFYLCCCGRDQKPLKLDDIINKMKIMLSNCGTDAAKFMFVMTKGGLRNFLERQDFEPLMKDVLDTHPGLQFLQSSVDFHQHYINTVIARIFFNLDRNWDDRITLAELQRSDLLWVLNYLEKHADINMITQYFSYEHFYVIYCKFWELDIDHNLIISRNDLLRHNNFALSERIIDRIFDGTVLRKPTHDKTMQYPEFVWFLLAEEDKSHPRSIEYWFRLMDLDGDGFISLYELEYFYQGQLLKMEERGIEPLNFTDSLCMMLDAVKPQDPNKISLQDLKRCKLTSIFFNTFINLHKYLEHEQADSFNNYRDIEEGLPEVSDWDRFAADTYEQLMMEDSQQQELINSSNEFDGDDNIETSLSRSQQHQHLQSFDNSSKR